MTATTLGQGPKTARECQGIAQRSIVCDADPKKSTVTLAVGIAVAAGYRWGKPKPYLDCVEEIRGELVRRITWAFDSGSTARFDGENVPLGAFWGHLFEGVPCHTGPTLTTLRAAYAETIRYPDAALWAAQLRERAPAVPRIAKILTDAAKIHEEFRASKMPRFLLVRRARGKTEARVYIPFHATAEERAKLLSDAGL